MSPKKPTFRMKSLNQTTFPALLWLLFHSSTRVLVRRTSGGEQVPIVHKRVRTATTMTLKQQATILPVFWCYLLLLLGLVVVCTTVRSKGEHSPASCEIYYMPSSWSGVGFVWATSREICRTVIIIILLAKINALFFSLFLNQCDHRIIYLGTLFNK